MASGDDARTILMHHARVLRLSDAFAGRPVIFICERNKGHEAEYYYEHFRQGIEPGVSIDTARSCVFAIRQLDSMPTGKKLVHGWWTTAKEKKLYLESIINHMGTARDLRIEKNVFSVCPFQLSAMDMTPEKLAKYNVTKLISQCKRYQHVQEEATSALSMPRAGFSGTVNLKMKHNANAQDDVFMALGIGLRMVDMVRGGELSDEMFPWSRFRASLHGFSQRGERG